MTVQLDAMGWKSATKRGTALKHPRTRRRAKFAVRSRAPVRTLSQLQHVCPTDKPCSHCIHQLEAAQAFVEAFDARMSGDLLAEPVKNLPSHPLFHHLARLWSHYIELERQEQEVAGLACGVISVDEDGSVETINGRAISLLGLNNAGQAVGEPVAQLLLDEVTRAQLTEALAAPCLASRTIPYQLSSASGNSYLELSIGPHPKAFQCSILVIDVTQRELLEKELRRARDLALAHERRTSEFLASMSHELRTPMNGVIGMVTLLTQTSLTEDQTEIVQLMRRSGEHLLCIINDILDLAKLEAGHVALDPIAVELESLLQETIASHEPTAAPKALELLCEVAADVPFSCHLDPLRVRQVLTNLVGNAIKFTERGSVKVTCTRPSSATLKIEVQDTGIGIPDEHLPRLFQAFAQADTGATRRYEGTGLGLTISKKLVSCMGGDMGVSSAPGRGSNFWFSIPIVSATGTLGERYHNPERPKVGVLFRSTSLEGPVRTAFSTLNWDLVKLSDATQLNGLGAALFDAEALTSDDVMRLSRQSVLSPKQIALIPTPRQDERALARKQGLTVVSRSLPMRSLQSLLYSPGTAPVSDEAAVKSNLGGTTVLVAEDNLVNQKVVKRLLEKAGARVIVAGDGEEAVKCVSAHADIDMVLMDCQMPRVDGFEATRRIRESHPSLPVCALTADATAGDKERCFEAGMNDYLTKPIQYELLIKTVHNWTLGTTTYP